MHCRPFLRTLFAILALVVSSDAWSADEVRKKVLVIGIDGCRPDALQAAATPHLDSLIENGIYADDTQILGERYNGNDTISGPGWSSILIGVWADKHGVDGNKFTGPNYDEFPHFFQRIKEVRPDAVTISIADWEPITTKIVTAADVSKHSVDEQPDNKANPHPEHDVVVARDAVEQLKTADPDAIFVYLGQVDETGHRYGFHPRLKRYKDAIERVDGHVGELLAALASRENREREDWLILVTTDHGGRGTGHSNGHSQPDIRNGFLIVSGPAARRGRFQDTTYLVDVVPTALTHLGLEINPEWKLDGRSVGLK